MDAWPAATGTFDRAGVPARVHPAVPVLPRVRRVIEDLDRAIEDAVKEALERDRAERETLRREREAEPGSGEPSASDPLIDEERDASDDEA